MFSEGKAAHFVKSTVPDHSAE
jgi:hypothetical protein